MNMYQFLHTHEDLHAEEGEPLFDFYESESAANIGKFMGVDTSIAQGFYEEARAINNSIEVDYSLRAEPEIKKYYDLYLNYADSAFAHTTESDSVELLNLAHACPSFFGEAVYKAGALFAMVYGTPIASILECGDDEGGRRQFPRHDVQDDSVAADWNFEIRPNPNNGEFTVVSQSGPIKRIVIRDVSGRCVRTLENNANSSAINGNVHLPGLYFITAYSQRNESITKKLVVSQ